MARGISITIWLLAAHPGLLSAAEPQDWVESNLEGVVQLYRELHRAPELSFQEEKTALRLATELAGLGADVTSNVGGHGVVAILKNGQGPTLMLRTDTDALPVVENTDLVYASTVKAKNESGEEVGVMHACGHDIHMANLVGVARYLAEHKDEWRGTVLLICQPAEERGAGARAMLEDGLFERFPKPDFALALHVDATLAVGKVGFRAGYALANVDNVDITVRGRGGHGASPDTTIDPIVQAAHLIVDLQTIVSRETKPIDPAVITVGSIHGGTKHNIIGDTCHLQLTVRSYTQEVRERLLAGIRRKALAAAASAGAPEPTIEVTEGTPALENDAALVDRVVPVLRQAIGDENVTLSEPSMGGEDFSLYGRAGVPIFMFRLGSVEAKRLARYEELGQKPPSLHSPVYYPDAEETLKTGLISLTAAALDILAPNSTPPAANMRRYLSLPNLLWLAAWIATMAGLWLGLAYARERTIARLTSAEAQAEWQAYLRAQKDQAADPNSPVQRRLPGSAEPPALVLMRDNFAAILATAWVTGTFLFAFLMFALRGAWRQRGRESFSVRPARG